MSLTRVSHSLIAHMAVYCAVIPVPWLPSPARAEEGRDIELPDSAPVVTTGSQGQPTTLQARPQLAQAAPPPPAEAETTDAEESEAPAAAEDATPASEVTLPPVTVTATTDSARTTRPFAGGQVSRVGNLGLLGDRDFMETPFSTRSITEEWVRNLQANNAGELLRTDASAQVQGGEGFSFIVYRGFSSNGSGLDSPFGVNGLFGLTGQQPLPNTAPFASIEVLAGPSALLSGFVSGSSGGSFNAVTKRADDEPLARVSAQFSSHRRLGAAVDLGRRFGDDNQRGCV